jgi:hypothetical protein
MPCGLPLSACPAHNPTRHKYIPLISQTFKLVNNFLEEMPKINGIFFGYTIFRKFALQNGVADHHIIFARSIIYFAFKI